jgi:hypothetical protein
MKPSKRGGGRRSDGVTVTTIKYYINPDRHSTVFQDKIRSTLNHATKGITARTNGAVVYKQTGEKNKADLVVSLTSQKKINQVCGFSKLSCSVVSYDTKYPDKIMLSLENWNGAALPKFGGTLSDYRTYVINHEFLHCRPFRHDHPRLSRCSNGEKTPVLHQQTLGLPPNCLPNVWPLDTEVAFD